MAQTELLNSISKSIDYPVEQNLSASYHCGTFSLIVDTDLWTEQMYYELPWIQLDIYITVGGIDIKYLSCNIMLDTDEPKKPYSVSVYGIPGSFKVKLTPGFDDNVITTHNELCLQEDISNTWGPQTLEFPCSVVWDDSNISSSSGDVGAEVYQARVGADGTTYQTLKARLDAAEDRTATITEELNAHYQLTNRYTKIINQVAGTAHLLTIDKISVDIATGNTVKISLKNDILSQQNSGVFATNQNNETSLLCQLSLSGTVTVPISDNYISFGLYFDAPSSDITVTFDIEVYKDEQKKEIRLSKSDLTEGSLQTASMRVAADSAAFCYLTKVPLLKLQQLKVIVPEIDGVYYKYRYGRYKSDEVCYDQIAGTKDDVITQNSVCAYVSVGIYAYNVSDNSQHAGILSEYSDIDEVILQYQNDFENRFIPLDQYSGILELKDATQTNTTDITRMNSEITGIEHEIENACAFSKFDYDKYTTEGYYLPASTGQPKESASSAYAMIPCSEGDRFIVDFAGSQNATPLFAAGADGKAVKIFVNTGTIPAEPVEVTISSGLYLVMNYIRTGKPLVKKFQLGGGGSDDDDTIVGINKGFEDYAIQALRRINLSGNAYRLDPQPLSIMHFSDIHGDATELGRMKEFYTKYENYFDDAICTGDLVRLRFNNDFSFWDWDEVLLVMGNHDVLADTEGWDWSLRATQQEQYIKYFGNIADWGCVYEEGKTYYYKDYANKKIRLIILNCMLTGTDNEQQLTWFTETLTAAITANLFVVVVNHYPVRNFTKINCNFTTLDTTFNNETAVNMDAYQAAIETFKTNGGNFICWVAGHTHFDLIGYNSNYPTQYCVCVDTLSREQGNQYSDTQRTNNTKSQDLANMFVVDTTSSVIKLIRIGAAKDHYLRSKKSITLNYATGAIVTSD